MATGGGELIKEERKKEKEWGEDRYIYILGCRSVLLPIIGLRVHVKDDINVMSAITITVTITT